MWKGRRVHDADRADPECGSVSHGQPKGFAFTADGLLGPRAARFTGIPAPLRMRKGLGRRLLLCQGGANSCSLLATGKRDL